MKIEPPVVQLKPSDTCMWLEESRLHNPTALPAIVVESSGDTLRLVVFNRSGGVTVKSGVLPYGHHKMTFEDGSISPSALANGSWFVHEGGSVAGSSEGVAELAEKVEKLSAVNKKLGDLARRLTALEKAINE